MRSVLTLFLVESTRHLDFADFADSVVEGDSNYDGKMLGAVPAGAAAAPCNDRGVLDTSPFSILHLCSLDHVRSCEFCASVILMCK